jgi:hypothetical protein
MTHSPNLLPRYPELPADAPQEIRTAWNELIRSLGLRDRAASSPAGKFSVSNHVQNRTLDVSTATASDIAEVLGTLLKDLQQKGLLDLT